MVSKMRYLFLLCVAILSSCTKNEFNLDFELDTHVTENYNVTYYATDRGGDGKTIQAVASVREGKCELKGLTREPTLLYISTRISPLPLVIYAKRGDKIVITGEDDKPLDWIVEGNDINKDLTDWRKEYKDILSENLPDSVNMAVERFVNVNTQNPVSAILMLCYYNRSINQDGYYNLMSSLDLNKKEKEWLAMIGRADQLVPEYSSLAMFKSMVKKSLRREGDTLYTNNKDPLFLFFWQTGYADRKNLIDSIRSLEKEVPDSSRFISDICLDVDSLSWRNAMRKDTLDKSMKRFWIPMGLADPDVMKLKIEKIPYFIVFDKKGKQVYRGNDVSEAMKEYRQLLNPKDSAKKN